MTDSGGYQVFSLGTGFGKNISKVAITPTEEDGLDVFKEEHHTEHAKLARIDEEGVTFTSHIDGSLHRFTPERSI
jgi:queuine tRNA-ribosyltransferase